MRRSKERLSHQANVPSLLVLVSTSKSRFWESFTAPFSGSDIVSSRHELWVSSIKV